MSRVIIPKEYAACAHADSGQKYEDQHYEVHLEAVISVFDSFVDTIVSEDDGYVLAGILETAIWLHDILEDTNVTYLDLLELFGKNVADLVMAVTDSPGINRKERKRKTLPKIREYGKYAVAIKLCDRIASVKNCIDTKSNLFNMYAKEHESFFKELYSKEDGLDDLWTELSNLILNEQKEKL